MTYQVRPQRILQAFRTLQARFGIKAAFCEFARVVPAPAIIGGRLHLQPAITCCCGLTALLLVHAPTKSRLGFWQQAGLGRLLHASQFNDRSGRLVKGRIAKALVARYGSAYVAGFTTGFDVYGISRAACTPAELQGFHDGQAARRLLRQRGRDLIWRAPVASAMAG